MSYNFLANETWILLFLETELNLVWQVGGGVGSGISGGSSPSPRILPGPGTGEPPFLLIPLWDPELLAVQVLSPGEAPGRQPLPPEDHGLAGEAVLYLARWINAGDTTWRGRKPRMPPVRMACLG